MAFPVLVAFLTPLGRVAATSPHRASLWYMNIHHGTGDVGQIAGNSSESPHQSRNVLFLTEAGEL